MTVMVIPTSVRRIGLSQSWPGASMAWSVVGSSPRLGSIVAPSSYGSLAAGCMLFIPACMPSGTPASPTKVSGWLPFWRAGQERP